MSSITIENRQPSKGPLVENHKVSKRHQPRIKYISNKSAQYIKHHSIKTLVIALTVLQTL